MSTPIDAMFSQFMPESSNNNDSGLPSTPSRTLTPKQFSPSQLIPLTPIQRVNTMHQTPTYPFLSPFTHLQSAMKSNLSSTTPQSFLSPKSLFRYDSAEIIPFHTEPTFDAEFNLDFSSYTSDSDTAEKNSPINDGLPNLEEDISLGSTESDGSKLSSEELITSFFATLSQKSTSFNEALQSNVQDNDNRKRVLAPIDNLQTMQNTGAPILMLKQLSDAHQKMQNGTAEKHKKFPPAELRPKGWIPKPKVLPQFDDSDEDSGNNDSNKENKLSLEGNASKKKQKIR